MSEPRGPNIVTLPSLLAASTTDCQLAAVDAAGFANAGPEAWLPVEACTGWPEGCADEAGAGTGCDGLADAVWAGGWVAAPPQPARTRMTGSHHRRPGRHSIARMSMFLRQKIRGHCTSLLARL